VLEPDHYGLESLDLLELDELPKEETGKEAHVSEMAQAVAPDKAPEPRPARRSGLINNKWKAIYITTGTLIVILAVLIFIPTGRKGDPARKSSILKKRPPIEATQQNGPQQEGNTPDQADPVSQGNQPQALEAQPEEQKPEPVAATPNFYIIAGSFKHLQNASEMQDQLKARGYKSEVLITENRMYRVTVASYATEAEAEKFLSGMKSEPGLKSAWILSN